jgi:hypothetical protein
MLRIFLRQAVDLSRAKNIFARYSTRYITGGDGRLTSTGRARHDRLMVVGLVQRLRLRAAKVRRNQQLAKIAGAFGESENRNWVLRDCNDDPVSLNVTEEEEMILTAVFNITLAEAQCQPSIGSILGARYGITGLLQRDIVDLSVVTAPQLNGRRRTPGAALSSSRHNPSDDELDRLVQTLRDFKINHLLFTGGNGTMRGASR